MTYTYRTRRRGRKPECSRCRKKKENPNAPYCHACKRAYRLERLGRKIIWVHKCEWCGRFFMKRSVHSGRPKFCCDYHKLCAYRARKRSGVD